MHKIAILDIRIVNTDRHSANILIQKQSLAKKKLDFRLIPIDHGMCLPDSFELSEYSFLSTLDWSTAG